MTDKLTDAKKAGIMGQISCGSPWRSIRNRIALYVYLQP